MTAALRVGSARVAITPTVPVPLAGYPAIRLYEGGPPDHEGYTGRVGASTGVHDPLYARATAWATDSEVVVLVSLDVCLVPLTFTNRIRAAAHRWALSPHLISLVASHTHSATDYTGFWDSIDSDQELFVVEMTLLAIDRAIAALRPARLGVGEGFLVGPIVNRRDPVRPIDPRVTVIRADDESGNPIAVLFCYACHPIVVGPQDTMVSADYPGYSSALIEQAFGPSCVALFLNGAAGNVNPAAFPYASLDVSRLAKQYAREGKVVDFRSHRDARRLGTALGGEAVRVASLIETQDKSVLGWWRTDVDLRLKPPDLLERYIYHENLSPRTAATLRGRSSIRSEVVALRLGEALLLGFPGEPFVEIGLDLQQRRADWPQQAVVRVIGYVNDYPEYILRPEDYLENRYESVSTCLDVEGARAAVAAVADLRDRALDAW